MNKIKSLSSKRLENAFTLIELLVVINIIGVLAAIALPNLLNQVGKERQSEAKSVVATMNRSQQAWTPLRPPLVVPELVNYGIVIQSSGPPIRLTSMESIIRRADNFSGLTESIHGVYWTGISGGGSDYCTRYSNIFEISFYSDNNGLPGDLVHSYQLTPTQSELEHIYGDDNPNAIVDQYSASLPEPVNLSSGWISIRAIGDWECVWGWSLDNGDGALLLSDSASTSDDVEWVSQPQINFSFALLGAANEQASTAGDQPATFAAHSETIQGAPSLQPDIISDIAQAGWIASILVGDTYLSSADRAIVKGSVDGGGVLGNKAFLKDPDFVSAVSQAIAEAYGVPEVLAAPVADGFTSLWVYWMSIDHMEWLEFYASTELGPVFDAFDAATALNSDAGTIVGGSADPDHDGISNEDEWRHAVASGLYYEKLVALFVNNAERSPDVFKNGLEPLPPFKDLMVLNPLVNLTSLASGQDLTISAIAYNLGRVASAISTMRFFLSNTLTITSADLELGSISLDSLTSGQQSSRELLVPIDANVGSYWVGACVDPVAGETDVSNQCSPGVGIQVTGPDLTITNPAVNKATLVPSEAFTISTTATNLSSVTSAASTTRYYLSSDDQINPAIDDFLGTSNIPPLAAGASSPQSFPATAPAVSGDYWVGACAEDLPDETDTGNQCSTAVPIHVLSPDLAISSFAVSKSTLQPSESFTVNATAVNLGPAPSTGSEIRVYSSGDPQITPDDTLMGSSSIGGLASGATAFRSVPVSAPADGGYYYVGVCVVPVANELITNNQCSAAVEIEVTRPDLVTINPSVFTGPIYKNTAFPVFATAKNQGGAASPATTMRYYVAFDSDFQQPGALRTATAVGALAPGGEAVQITNITLLSSGIHYFGACLVPVANESDSSNQCSDPVLFFVNP